jgi:broad specificity phosphatase PhoE
VSDYFASIRVQASTKFAGPSGLESISGQISDRADRLIARLRVLDGSVALFSHGHFRRALAALDWIAGVEVFDQRKNCRAQ